MSENSKPPKGTETWRIPKKKGSDDKFEIVVNPDKLDENPVLFQKYSQHLFLGEITQGAEVILRGIYVSGDDLGKVLGNGFSMRCLQRNVMGLMDIEEVEIKKN